jgi:hypothetical protein
MLKGPKLEIFGFRVFSQIRPVRVGDLGTRQKNLNFDSKGLKIADRGKNFKCCRRYRLKIFAAVADSA